MILLIFFVTFDVFFLYIVTQSLKIPSISSKFKVFYSYINIFKNVLTKEIKINIYTLIVCVNKHLNYHPDVESILATVTHMPNT